MDVATTSRTDAPPSDPLQVLDSQPISVVVQQRIMKLGSVGSPDCRSTRPSCLPLPPPVEFRDVNSDDESESVNDVALYLFREKTPENDVLPLDEPSTVLANRILRAHDNPSPPPQDTERPGVCYIAGKEDRLSSHVVSVPPSPFRPINLLERLNQLSDPPSRSLPTPTLGDRPDTLQPGTLFSWGFIAPESCSPSVTSAPVDSATHDNSPADVSSTQFAVDRLPPRPIRHVCGPANTASSVGNLSFQPADGLGHLTTMTSSLDTELFVSSPRQATDSSLYSVMHLTSDVCSVEPQPSPGQQTFCESSLNSITRPSPTSIEDGKTVVVKTIIASGEDKDKKELLSEDNSLSVLEGPQQGKHRNREPIEQTILPTESTCIKRPPVTPPQTLGLTAMRPNFSRSTVQRPVVTPTPKQRKIGAPKVISPIKFASERDDACRTPAQRVPIETALARGNASYQKALQLSAGSGYRQPGHFSTIRAPVFTRPAPDDPSRSPAKRIPVTDSVTSPIRVNQNQKSPMQSSHRAGSASVEQRTLGPLLARSRSAEPSSTTSKPDDDERSQGPIFPQVPSLPVSTTRLPFPLIPGQKSISDMPPPILEENETEEKAKEINTTLGKVKQDTISQLRQPSVNSRIPRIGNKPYARPLLNGKATIGGATVYTTRASAPPFQLARKNNGVGSSNVEGASIQPSNDIPLVGSLKRKRGIETVAPLNPYPVMIRQVVPGMLSGKYDPKPSKILSQVQTPSETSPPKVTQPIKFRKVVDGMLSARYTSAKTNPAQTEPSEPPMPPPSPLSELSSSSNEELCEEKPPSLTQSSAVPKSETPDPDAPTAESSACDHPSIHQDADRGEPSTRPRRTSRSRKPAQRQNFLDVFNDNTPARPPPARRKPQARTEGDNFMGMSATALKALTTSNTTRNQQTVAVLATEVIRKEGLRPESPTVKARTILQKQRDERDMRRKERAQRKAQMSEEGLGINDTEGVDDRVSPGGHADHDENECVVSQKHRKGPGDEEDNESPERPERIIEPLRLEGIDRKVEQVKRVKWHRGLSTIVYVDEVDPRPKPLQKSAVVRGCLASTSKNLALDPLGNLVDIDNRSPELVTEQITVKRYLYDNDIEPGPTFVKMTRSKSKK